jgi:pyruvate kinase
MLSAESASGKYPLEAVSMQQKIISRVEADGAYRASLDRFSQEADLLEWDDPTAVAITLAAREVPVCL